MEKLRVKVTAKTEQGILSITQIIEEKELSKGLNIMKRKDLTLNQKMKFLRACKARVAVIGQFEVEILILNPLTVNFAFNVFSGTELITISELARKKSVEATMLQVGAKEGDYEVDYGI